MESLLILSYLRKFSRPIVFLSVFLSGLAFVVAAQSRPYFEASISIFVRREAQAPSVDFYSFDGYYSQQAAERFTDTVVGIIKNKELLQNVVEKSGFTKDVKEVLHNLKVKRISPQLVLVTFGGRDRSKTAIFTKDLAAAVAQKAILLNEGGDRFLSLSVLEPAPFIEEKRLSPPLVAFFVLGSTLLFLTLTVVGASYLSKAFHEQ